MNGTVLFSSGIDCDGTGTVYFSRVCKGVHHFCFHSGNIFICFDLYFDVEMQLAQFDNDQQVDFERQISGECVKIPRAMDGGEVYYRRVFLLN